jgi:hypothetical protein
MAFTVDELLAKIDAVKKEGFGPEPSFFEVLLHPGTRDLKRAIEDAKTSAIRVRKDLIDGLGGCISIYVDTHRADLKVRGAGFVSKTFVDLTGKLNGIVEGSISSFYEIFSRQCDDYDRIKNLTEPVRQELKQKALERAHRITEMSESVFFDLIEALKQQVIRLSEEIGER